MSTLDDRLPILFRDDHLVAVHKPAGMLVHPSRVDRGESVCAMKRLRDTLGRWVYPLHRLDKPTSGILLFALDPATARRLGEAFEARRVHKTYLAVVRGYTDAEGVIDHPLKERLDPMTDTRARVDKAAQPAVTTYRRLARVELPYPCAPHATSRYSLLRLEPATGRRHQLRRHLKHIAHPVVGDTSYGKSAHNHLFRDRLDSDRLLLAAVELVFPHPGSGERQRVVAPLAGELAVLLRRLGWGSRVPPDWLAWPDPCVKKPSKSLADHRG